MAKLDKDDLELILNACLNEALCRKQRIKTPNSNAIAEFVTNWINKTDLSVRVNETSEPPTKALPLHGVMRFLKPMGGEALTYLNKLYSKTGLRKATLPNRL